MNNLTIVEQEGVEFYTDSITGRSGISQTGLAKLCGVTRDAISKLINSLYSGKPYKGLESLVSGIGSDKVWKSQTGMVIICESFALDIIRYYYKQGKCSEIGCKAIGMPVFDPKKLKSKRIEALIQNRLHEKLGGSIEVPTEAGRIDLVTATEIIEIKEVKSWKCALGQLLVYGACYPSHQKRLYLFGDCHKSFISIIEKHCDRLGIVLTWEA